MIQESTIEAQLSALEKSDFQADLAAFAKAQPHLMDYLATDDNGAFVPAEQELLFFAGLVIFRSILAEKGTLNSIDGNQIATFEEANFALLQEQSAKGFRERITVFFDNSEEEEILAFIEDLLLDEESDSITPEGREPLFITLKTVMDALLS